MKHVLISILFCIVLAAIGCSQNIPPDKPEAKSSPDKSSYYIPRMIKKDGWQIPGLGEAEVIDPRGIAEGASTGTTKVYHTGLRPKRAELVDFTSYFGEEYRIPESKLKKLSVLRINRYDANGKVFCYVLDVEEKGFVHALLFFDEDGDGRFEVVRESDLDQAAYAPSVPEWALK